MCGIVKKQIPDGERILRRARRRRRRKWQIRFVVALIIFIAIFSYLTNPFVRFSVIRDPYTSSVDGSGNIRLTSNRTLILYDNILAAVLAQTKSGWHIAVNRIRPRYGQNKTTVDDIISAIHNDRFDPDKPYLISGEHFSVLYPRSLGIFYHTLIDPRTALDSADWLRRQEIYLKTTAFALSVFQQANRLSTTVVPVGPRSVTLMNIYAPPSDTLYSLLYALRTLRTSDDLEQVYPFLSQHPKAYYLKTTNEAQVLLDLYTPSLREHLTTYTTSVYNPSTGLLRNDVILSGTKDSVKRRQAFYDHVIFWKTHQLAQQLGITQQDSVFLSTLKRRIIDAFWYESGGYFLEDLEKPAPNYASDWLVAVSTGFLDLNNPTERTKAQQTVTYIKSMGLDKPFPLKYQPNDQRDNMHLVVSIFAPTYASSAIWSHWGMEYIKLLTRLYQTTCQRPYLTDAKQHTYSYEHNILRFRGFPEVYDEYGNFYTTSGYKSIRGTGWVVNFEQARAMVNWTDSHMNALCGQ